MGVDGVHQSHFRRLQLHPGDTSALWRWERYDCDSHDLHVQCPEPKLGGMDEAMDASRMPWDVSAAM